MTLDATGFTPKTLSGIQAELEIAYREAFGAGTKLTAESVFGKLIGIDSEREDEIWQLLQALYDSFNPITASLISLDRIAAITGVSRNPATRSTIVLYLAGTNGTVIPIQTLVEITTTQEQFRTLVEITLDDSDDFAIASDAPVGCTITRSGAIASVAATAHGLPNEAIVTIFGADQTEYNITAVISNVSANAFDYTVFGAPTSPATGTITFVDEGHAQDPGGTTVVVRAVAHGLVASDIRILQGANEADYNRVVSVVSALDVDHFTYEGGVSFTTTPATGSFVGKEANLVNGEASLTGVIQSLAHTAKNIINAISGWDTVDNLNDADVGVAVETDAAFRTRRAQALQGLGNATLEAIRADMLLISGVSTAFVFENATDVTVGIRTPHSIEAVVQGGADQDIWDALFDTKAAGIQTVGAESGITTDSQGTVHTVKFSRPAIRDIWIDIDVTVDSDYPVDGDTQVAIALKAEGDLLTVGEDVIPIPQLIGALDTIPGIRDIAIGVLDVPDGDPDPNPTPGTDDGPITIAETDLTEFDTGRITVTQV